MGCDSSIWNTTTHHGHNSLRWDGSTKAEKTFWYFTHQRASRIYFLYFGDFKRGIQLLTYISSSDILALSSMWLQPIRNTTNTSRDASGWTPHQPTTSQAKHLQWSSETHIAEEADEDDINVSITPSLGEVNEVNTEIITTETPEPEQAENSAKLRSSFAKAIAKVVGGSDLVREFDDTRVKMKSHTYSRFVHGEHKLNFRGRYCSSEWLQSAHSKIWKAQRDYLPMSTEQFYGITILPRSYCEPWT